MESICIPRRYLHPDPVTRIGTVTYEEQRDLNFQVCLAYQGLGVKHGRVVRKRRIVNSFMQIYSVQFLDSEEEELDQVCGNMVADVLRIFDRQMDKGSRHDIDPQGYARLTGPMFPIDAVCDIKFYPRLFRKNQPRDFFHPHSGVKFDEWGWPIEDDVAVPTLDKPGLYGKFLLEQRSMMKRCNKILSEEIRTTCGPLKVTHAVFNDAAVSFLTVKLLEWHGEGDAANVYGKICTSDTLLCDAQAKSVLFDLKREEHVSVKPEQYIHMHRPVTVVPMGHQLKVEVSILHKYVGSGDSNDKDVVIAKGTCFFLAKSTEEDLPSDADQSTDEDQSEDEDGDESESVDEDQSECADEDQSADDKDQSEGEDQSADDKDQSEGEDQSADDKDQSEGENQPADDKDQSDGENQPANEDQSADEISETEIISGEWGKVELNVYWLPCWCRSYLPCDDETIEA